MKPIFVLEYSCSVEHEVTCSFLVHCFYTRSDAEAFRDLLRDKPGFADYPGDFNIVEAPVGMLQDQPIIEYLD